MPREIPDHVREHRLRGIARAIARRTNTKPSEIQREGGVLVVEADVNKKLPIGLKKLLVTKTQKDKDVARASQTRR